MVWTTPRTWVAGEVPTASLLNTHVKDNPNFLYNRPRVKTTNSAAYNLSTGGGNMSHNVEVYDTDSMFSPTSHQCTINTPGTYIMGSAWSHATVANVGVRQVNITDGTNSFLKPSYTATGTDSFSVEGCTEHNFPGTATLSHFYYHNHGSTLTGTKFQTGTPTWWEQWVGA